MSLPRVASKTWTREWPSTLPSSTSATTTPSPTYISMGSPSRGALPTSVSWPSACTSIRLRPLTRDSAYRRLPTRCTMSASCRVRLGSSPGSLLGSSMAPVPPTAMPPAPAQSSHSSSESSPTAWSRKPSPSESTPQPETEAAIATTTTAPTNTHRLRMNRLPRLGAEQDTYQMTMSAMATVLRAAGRSTPSRLCRAVPAPGHLVWTRVCFREPVGSSVSAHQRTCTCTLSPWTACTWR